MVSILKKNYIETESNKFCAVRGLFTGEAIKPDFGVVRSFGLSNENPNLITDLGLNALGGSASFTRMHLGTGTSVPLPSDTSLQNFGVSVSSLNPIGTNGVDTDADGYYAWIRYTWTSETGGATGNWTEIGISNQNSNGNLRSRALILDGSGNPTSFPVLADEQFRGTYEFRLYVPNDDYSSSISLSGTPYDTVTRSIRASSPAPGSWRPNLNDSSSIFRAGADDAEIFSGGLSPITDLNPLGSSLASSNLKGTEPYGSGNFYLDSSVTFSPSTTITGRTIVFPLNGGGRFQIEYSPTFNKLSNMVMVHNQRVKWGRK